MTGNETGQNGLKYWQITFRNGIAPSLSSAGLQALKKGLESNDEALIQNKTALADNYTTSNCRGACAIGYGYWKGDKNGFATFDEVENFFIWCLSKCDVGGRTSSVFLNWFDYTPRQQVFKELLDEVNFILSTRKDTTGEELQCIN